jgi:phosphatidylglycerophosphate synthase
VLDNGKIRAISAKRIDPIARRFLKFGVTPDEVTIVGALLACLISFQFLSQGSFLLGGILISLVGLADLLDGTMARLSNTSGPWGSFLDSTLDRIVDGAIYGSLIFWYAHEGEKNRYLLIGLLVGLVAAQATSYTRAKWESLGVVGKIGFAERSERMIALCTGLIITGLGFDIMPLVITGLAIASSYTVFQRIIFVRKQLKL